MYTFRFNVIENITRTGTGISATFGRMGSAARQFSRNVNTSAVSMDHLEQESRQAAAATRQVFRNTGAAQLEASVFRIGNGFSFIRNTAAAFGLGSAVRSMANFGDRLITANALTAGITRNVKSMTAAQRQALDLSNLTGESYLHSYEGLTKMLTVTEGNVEKATHLTKIGAALAAMNLAEGFEGALFSLKELESGDTVSLLDRFNIRVPTREEAKKIAARDGRSVQQVMFDSLQQYLDNNYGGGKAGAGVEYLLKIRSQTIGGQMSRVANQFKNIFTPMLLPFLEKTQTYLTGTAEWVNKNTENIARWGAGLGQIAVRAAAVYGIFIGYKAIGEVWTFLAKGVGLFSSGLYKVGFYAAWGVGRMGTLTMATSRWALSAVMGAGRAVRAVGVYVANLFWVNRVQNRLYLSFAWARIVSGFGSMVGAVRAYSFALMWANFQTRALGMWGGVKAAFASFITVAIPGMWTFIKTLRFAALWQGFVNTVMLANPIGVIIAGVLALGAVFYGTFKLIDSLFPNFFSGIKEWFGKAWDWVYNNFIKPIVDVFKWLADITGITAAFDMSAAGGGNEADEMAKMDADNKAFFEKMGIKWDEKAFGGGKGAGKGVGLGAGIGVNDKLNSISGGGREGVKNINITIQKQIESLNFYETKGVSGITSVVRREIERAMMDAANDANYSI